jgi:hypothetical protein
MLPRDYFFQILKYSADTLNLSVAVTHPVEKIQQNTYNNN